MDADGAELSAILRDLGAGDHVRQTVCARDASHHYQERLDATWH